MSDDVDICSITLAGGNDNTPLEFISRKRLERLQAIERAAIAVCKADQAGVQAAYERLVAVVAGSQG